jgi:hypothetical protein
MKSCSEPARERVTCYPPHRTRSFREVFAIQSGAGDGCWGVVRTLASALKGERSGHPLWDSCLFVQ